MPLHCVSELERTPVCPSISLCYVLRPEELSICKSRPAHDFCCPLTAVLYLPLPRTLNVSKGFLPLAQESDQSSTQFCISPLTFKNNDKQDLIISGHFPEDKTILELLTHAHPSLEGSSYPAGPFHQSQEQQQPLFFWCIDKDRHFHSSPLDYVLNHFQITWFKTENSSLIRSEHLENTDKQKILIVHQRLKLLHKLLLPGEVHIIFPSGTYWLVSKLKILFLIRTCIRARDNMPEHTALVWLSTPHDSLQSITWYIPEAPNIASIALISQHHPRNECMGRGVAREFNCGQNTHYFREK